MDDADSDLVCCECDGPVTIVERDASIISAVCIDCGNCHDIEVVTDTDGNSVYWPSFRISLKGE